MNVKVSVYHDWKPDWARKMLIDGNVDDVVVSFKGSKAVVFIMLVIYVTIFLDIDF
jgi:hypothetical protein